MDHWLYPDAYYIATQLTLARLMLDKRRTIQITRNFLRLSRAEKLHQH